MIDSTKHLNDPSNVPETVKIHQALLIFFGELVRIFSAVRELSMEFQLFILRPIVSFF